MDEVRPEFTSNHICAAHMIKTFRSSEEKVNKDKKLAKLLTSSK